MVNALLPDERGVMVTAQSRDARQREFRMEYTINPRWPIGLVWLGVSATGLVAIAVARTRDKRKTTNE